MSMIDPESQFHLNLHADHKRQLLAADQQATSLERKGRPAEPPYPIEDLDCGCGGTYDEYDRCSDCSNGHDDCSSNECFACLERSIDRAERMAEGMER